MYIPEPEIIYVAAFLIAVYRIPRESSARFVVALLGFGAYLVLF